MRGLLYAIKQDRSLIGIHCMINHFRTFSINGRHDKIIAQTRQEREREFNITLQIVSKDNLCQMD